MESRSHLSPSIDAYRAWLRIYDHGKWAAYADCPDEKLEAAIQRASERIGRRRLSWHIVAAEIMDEDI